MEVLPGFHSDFCSKLLDKIWEQKAWILLAISKHRCNDLLRVEDAVAVGPFSPHLFLAEMVMVNVVLRCTSLGFSATLTVVSVHSHVVVVCCIPDVEDTLIS